MTTLRFEVAVNGNMPFDDVTSKAWRKAGLLKNVEYVLLDKIMLKASNNGRGYKKIYCFEAQAYSDKKDQSNEEVKTEPLGQYRYRCKSCCGIFGSKHPRIHCHDCRVAKEEEAKQ